MKRLLFRSLFVLFLIAAFSLASCNRMEENPDNAQEIQQPAGIAFTATLAPKGENPQTKAISSGTDDNGKEILNVAWAVDEKIALYYQISGGYAKATAKVTEVNDGVATISASLDATTIDGGTVQFVYPASLANDKGDDIDESKLMTQYGKLDGIDNSISKRFDAATGDGIIKLSGGTTLPTTATVTNKAGTGSVSLQNRVCICKFHLTVYTVGVNGTLVSLKEMNDDLTIRDGNGHTYTIKSTKEWPGEAPADAGNPGYGTGDDIYVAMLPITEKPLILSATYNNKNYTLTTQPGTLAAGKFYRNVPVTMQLENLEITGDITQTLTVPDGMTVIVNDANFDVTRAPAIVLGEGSKLILQGTNTVSATYADAIECNGNATIDFQSTTNTVTAVTGSNKGIQISDGKSLNITGGGSAALNGNIGVPASASLKFNGTAASHDIYIPDVTTLSAGGITVGSTITIADGATFTLSWTTLNVTSGPGIQCSGNATLILDGTNNVTTTAETFPAILPGGSGTTLTIQGSGSVTANGGQHAAGIGSGSFTTHITTVYACGNIVIKSGTITANGGYHGTGIGSGYDSFCGDITISGGTVTAKGGDYGAGIGSGSGEATFVSTCGDITISGGTVTATGGSSAAGIGSSYFGTCDDITISGGTVTANGGRYGAGIGSGKENTCGDITISGGTVTATARLYSAGIGSGFCGKYASINITDGISSINTTSGYSTSTSYQLDPIGKGEDDMGSGTLTIDGTTTWTAGIATTHLAWEVSTIIGSNDYKVTRWILTRK